MIYGSIRGDLTGEHGVFDPTRKAGVLHYAMPMWYLDLVWDPTFEKCRYNDAVGHYDVVGACFAEISDGLSQTVLLGESAGAPYTYYRQRRWLGIDPSTDDWHVESGFWCGPWASVAACGDWAMFNAPTAGFIELGGSECVHNCTNAYNNPHSFHPGGVSYVYADGSTHFLTNGIDHNTFRRLVMKADGEVIPAYE